MDPLLTKIDSDSSSNDEHKISITVNEDSSSRPHEAENVERCNCNPCTGSSVWSILEFLLNLVQVLAAIFVMTQAKDEHPETMFLVWIIGYTCGCVFILLNDLIVCDFSSVDEDDMSTLKKILVYFLVGWFVLLIWIYSSSVSSLYDHTQHFCGNLERFYMHKNIIKMFQKKSFVVIIWICAAVLSTTPIMFIYQILYFCFKAVYVIILIYCPCFNC
ncbi:hypothetical protein CARUB_v10011134mg [Capsella rubella]|uniref:Uncharacterized protein n=1 Tax=Capsella rubella TaxID=81985 RepID=R0I4Z4_9BRAS|nr:hypothetical protein CARUB_v10011134mg [Capsella rubella]